MRGTKFLNVARVKGRKTTLRLLARMANRHGLITGATGTGKTVTLQVMAEEFSRIGVPVFLADVKGDLSGLAEPAVQSSKLKKRIESLKPPHFVRRASPVTFYDVFGKTGLPAKTSVAAMGPMLMSRMLNLNATQQGVMSIIFKVAEENGMPMTTLTDLQEALKFCSVQDDDFELTYGRASQASLATIQRALVTYDSGLHTLFQPPQFNIKNLIQFGRDGRGLISILSADRLILNPRTYSTFLLWMMNELFSIMPEVGDAEKPKLAFFFDEAHLLFLDAPQILLEKIEQVVRLIRSKGVGVYFVTQNPIDVPEIILSQLGNRVQHALRAFTPRDARAVRFAAETFRVNPKLDVGTAITELGIGEALVSFLDDKGHPTPVERAYVFPPRSKMGVASIKVRERIMRVKAPIPTTSELLERIDASLARDRALLERTDPEKAKLSLLDLLFLPRPRRRRGCGLSLFRALGLFGLFRLVGGRGRRGIGSGN